jgi:hypothetical protein
MSDCLAFRSATAAAGWLYRAATRTSAADADAATKAENDGEAPEISLAELL